MSKQRSEAEWETWEFPREAALQDYVMKRLKAAKGVRATKISDRYNSGVSDILVCAAGRFVAIELKVGYNKATELQKQFLNEIREAGGETGIAYNWGDVKTILRRAGYECG